MFVRKEQTQTGGTRTSKLSKMNTVQQASVRFFNGLTGCFQRHPGDPVRMPASVTVYASPRTPPMFGRDEIPLPAPLVR